MDDEVKANAESLKAEGNEFIKGMPRVFQCLMIAISHPIAAQQWQQAIAKYNEAIELHPTAVYHSNRAMAHLKVV